LRARIPVPFIKDDGHIDGPGQDYEAPDDRAALAKAKQLLDGQPELNDANLLLTSTRTFDQLRPRSCGREAA
jgi:hypothetical protein